MRPAPSCILIFIHLIVSMCPQSDADGSYEIWIFEDEQLKPTAVTHYEDLYSMFIYVVRVRELNAWKRLPEIFCWVGAQSSKEDLAEAIRSAFSEEQFATANLSKGIRQEYQGRESRYFKEIFKPTPADEFPKEELSKEDYHFWQLGTKKPWLAETRMILVELQNEYDGGPQRSPEERSDPPKIVALKEMEFSSAYIDKDLCLFVFNPKMVYLHCKKNVMPTYDEEFLLRRSAIFVANKILKEVGPEAKTYILMGLKSTFQYKVIQQLTKEFDNISNAKLKRKNDEKHQSLASGLEQSPINLTVRRIIWDKSERRLINHDFSSHLFFFRNLQHHECYVIDPGSEVFSALVWMGKDTDPNVRRECIRDVNSRAKEKSPAITYIDENYTTRLIEGLRFSPADFIRTMERVYGSWTDIFHSVHEEPCDFGKFE